MSQRHFFRRDLFSLPMLVTALFHFAGVLLLGMYLLYIVNSGLYTLFNLAYISNYTGFLFLYTASLMRVRHKNGWWSGTILGGYFLLAGFPVFSGVIFRVIHGTMTLESLSIPPLARFLFGASVLLILSRSSVTEAFGFDSVPTKVRLVAAAGFSMALYWLSMLLLSSLFWGFVGGFSPKGLVSVVFSQWSSVPILLTIMFLPVGKALLRARRWAHNAALVLWSVIFAWSIADIAEIVGSARWFWLIGIGTSWHCFLGVFLGGLFLFWFLKPEVFAYFGLMLALRRHKVILTLAVTSGFTVLIVTSKFASLPILGGVFLF